MEAKRNASSRSLPSSDDSERYKRSRRRRNDSSDSESEREYGRRKRQDEDRRRRPDHDSDVLRSGERSDVRRARSKEDRTYRRRHDSRSRDRSRHRQPSKSPPPKRRRRSPDESRSPPRRSKAPLPSQVDSFRGANGPPAGASAAPPVEKQKPNFKPTGLLAKEANTVAGTTTVLKYHEPSEARKPPPKQAWRMYVFKNDELLDTIYIHQRSCWLVGRDEKVTDLYLEHPSISKQHAVIQFRYRTSTNQYGDKTSKVKPYLIDLESANGTKLNGKKIDTSRYMELIDGDVVRFGDSEREYVMMLPPADT